MGVRHRAGRTKIFYNNGGIVSMAWVDKAVSVLKVVLKLGGYTVGAVIEVYNPALGALYESIFNSVVQTEALMGPGGGARKKEFALAGLQIGMPAIQYLFNQAGKPITNPALFAAGVEKIQDGIVDILNATGSLTKSPSDGQIG